MSNSNTDDMEFEAVSVETCKQKCMNNCSCKAVIYEYPYSGDKEGTCHLLYELLTFSNVRYFAQVFGQPICV